MTQAVTITGQVLEVEHRQGSFTNDAGQAVSYDFHVAHVLTGRKVNEVRFNPDNGDARPPAEGAVITLDVEVPKGIKLIARKYREQADSKPAPVRAAG